MVSTKKFNYDAKNRKLIAELSDLYDSNKKIPWERVYPGSTDVGIRVVSENTGKEVTFVLNESKYDNEGELQYYTLIPTGDSVIRVPNCKGLSMILFND